MPGATAAFNVGGTGEFTASDLGTLIALGTNTGGFANGSFVGLDPTNAIGGTFTYGSIIADSNSGANMLGLTKLGTGTLILSGANTYSGGTNINAGTLMLSGSGTLGATSGALAINGGILDLNGTSQGVGNLTGSGGTILNDAFGTNVTLTIGNGNGTGGNYFGVIADHSSGTGTVALTKTGTGTITLSGTNTYSGGTTISAGTLMMSGLGTLGSTSGALTVNGGILDLDGTSQSVGNLTGSGGTILNNAAGTSATLTIGTGNGTGGNYFGVIEDNSNSMFGTVALTKTGTGTITLSGANNYSGATTINGGTLQFAKEVALYNNTPAKWTATNLIVASGATAAFNVGGTGEFTAGDLDTLLALGTNSGGFESGSFLGLDTTNAVGGTFTYGSIIANPNSGANILGLTKLGAGTLVLSGANTYTGGTNINAGTLMLSGSGTLGATSSTLTVNGGILDLDGTNQGVGNLTGTGGTILNNMTGTSVTLTIGNGNGTGGNYVGVIADGNGTMALTKTGTGTITLSGANTYSGGTNINGGTLDLGSLGALGSSGTISFGGGILEYSASNTTDYSGRFSAAANQEYSIDTDGQNVTFATTLTSVGGSLTKLGSGVLTLSVANTYTGGTNINGGTLNLGNVGALGLSGTISFGGGTLQYSASNATDYSSRFSAAANQEYSIDTNGQNVTFATALTSSGGGLTKLGNGVLTLGVANNYTGVTTVSKGILVINDPAGLGTGTSTVQVGGDRTTGGGTLMLANGGVSGFTLNRNVAISGVGQAEAQTSQANPQAFIFSQGALASVGNNTLAGSLTTDPFVTDRAVTDYGTLTLAGPVILGAGITSQFGGSSGNAAQPNNIFITGQITEAAAANVFEKFGNLDDVARELEQQLHRSRADRCRFPSRGQPG